MVYVKLLDDNGNELHFDDVVLVNYPNPNIKYLGILQFLAGKHNQFVLSDGCEHWQSLRAPTATSIEKICNLSERPELFKELGKFLNKTDVKAILEILNNTENEI